MTPRDRLAQELAALLPGCHVSADGSARIRVHFPDIGTVLLAVSKSGSVVEPCNEGGRATRDNPRAKPVCAADAAQIAVERLVRRWVSYSPTPYHLEQLAALGFADRVPDLARSALDRVTHARARLAEEIAERQEQDADLAVKAAAYRALVKP